MSPARISQPVGTCGSSIERGLQSSQAKLFHLFNNVPYFPRLYPEDSKQSAARC